MPVASHTKAAEQHDVACKAHKAAADLHSKGDHTGAVAKSLSANTSGKDAAQMSAEAHGKSTAQAK